MHLAMTTTMVWPWPENRRSHSYIKHVAMTKSRVIAPSVNRLHCYDRRRRSLTNGSRPGNRGRPCQLFRRELSALLFRRKPKVYPYLTRNLKQLGPQPFDRQSARVVEQILELARQLARAQDNRIDKARGKKPPLPPILAYIFSQPVLKPPMALPSGRSSSRTTSTIK